MIVLLDTDVLLDVALDRAPHVESSAALLDALEHGAGRSFVAWHTVANLSYLLASRRGRGGARAFVEELLRFVDVSPTTTESLRYATRLSMGDFEDAMQVAAAVACRADVMATRNVRDFARSPVRALTPRALLAELR